MDSTAAVRPIDEAASAIRRLVEYRSAGELADAIVAVSDALDRALRVLLRSDTEAPESERLRALAPDQLDHDQVVASLRRRERISIETAGRLHDVRLAAERARDGSARPADADVVGDAVARLRGDLEALAGPGVGSGADADPHVPVEPAPEPARPGPGRRWRWLAWLAAAIAILVIASAAWLTTRGWGAERADAVAAFRAGRYDSAAVRFERLLQDQPGDVTLMLYIGRSHRRLDRPAQAASALREAVATDPEDADVRRELGHLFMDLGQLRSAARQYERALEYDAEDPLNWTALIRVLRRMADPRAEALLGSAPPEVREAFEAEETGP